MRNAHLPGPVLKWAGGKTQLLDRILALLPERIDTYYEPFVGGAAVFFALARERRFRRAVLSDRNPDLVAVYHALQQDVEGVIEVLRGYRYSEEEYYRLRGEKPRSLVKRAARIIYLNKTGYNGLYRVNSSGQFNVPFGRYVNPRICDEQRLGAAAEALKDVKLVERDFEQTVRRAKPGDAVYFDPPYVPVSRTSNFTAYARDGFGMDEHARLARVFAEVAEHGARVVLSNSDTPETRELFGVFKPEKVLVARSINSRATGRGRIREILVSAGPEATKPEKRRAGRTR